MRIIIWILLMQLGDVVIVFSCHFILLITFWLTKELGSYVVPACVIVIALLLLAMIKGVDIEH